MSNTQTQTTEPKPAHTPGPWYAARLGAYNDFDGESRVILACETPENPPRRLAVTQVCDDETNANALLIAASPDLFSALEKIAKFKTWDEFNEADQVWRIKLADLFGIYEEAIEIARAAIAKATA